MFKNTINLTLFTFLALANAANLQYHKKHSQIKSIENLNQEFLFSINFATLPKAHKHTT